MVAKITTCVVKRKGHEEVYDTRKVYASVYSAAINCEYTEKESEALANDVVEKVNKWVVKGLKGKGCISSEEIRNFIVEVLKDEDVQIMYLHHLDLS